MRKYELLFNRRHGDWTIIFKDDGDKNWSVYLDELDSDKARDIVDALKTEADRRRVF